MSDQIIAPPPEAPAAPAPRPDAKLRGLALPPSGVYHSQLLGVAGLIFYFAFNGLMIGALVAHDQSTWVATIRQLVGMGDQDRNYPLLLLISLGFIVFIVCCVNVWLDIRNLRKEEEDVEWVHRHEREGLGLVFADADKREALFRKGVREASQRSGFRVDTLMDDRVRRVLEKEKDRYTLVSPDELRVIAETRTSRYGAVARFSSSLLLLLAVLGTFAGVKTALPGLIDAISQTGASGQGTGGIIGPLQAVADAFGGNALALVGAIAAGLMAQGLSMGRRNLLERLELVSSEYLYGGLQTGSMDPLTGAVNELRDTAGHMRDAGESIAGVEAGMSAMGESFRQAFGQLNERLVTIIEQQDQALHERTSKDLRELQRRVVDMAAVVEANTRAYGAIIDTVDERGRESHQMVELVRQSAGSLQSALQSVAMFQASAEKAATGVQDTLVALRTGGEVAAEGMKESAERMQAAAASIERAKPAIDEVEHLLVSFHERIEGLDRRAAEAWSSASHEVTTRLGEVLKEIQSDNGRRAAQASAAVATSSAGRDPEMVALMRRVATAVEDTGPSSRSLAIAHAGGIIGAVAVFVLGYGAYLLMGWLLAWLFGG
jgi:hypothetical protein